MKKAFTLLELVFVIFVIGVLVAAIIPRIDDNGLKEAALQLLSHIRYTQHLALTDDKYENDNPNWHRGRWQLVFSNSRFSDNQPAYTIFSDHDFGRGYSGDPTRTEIAIDPANRSRLLTGGYGRNVLDINSDNFIGTKKLNLGKSYGITNIHLSGGCHYSRISFDYLGRPMTGDQSTMSGAYEARTPRLIQSDCKIRITKDAKYIDILIRPETGYASIEF